jgi:hypothetical protein
VPEVEAVKAEMPKEQGEQRGDHFVFHGQNLSGKESG